MLFSLYGRFPRDRAAFVADRWNGPSEPMVDFYDWQGRFQILEQVEPKKKARGLS